MEFPIDILVPHQCDGNVVRLCSIQAGKRVETKENDFFNNDIWTRLIYFLFIEDHRNEWLRGGGGRFGSQT